MFRRSFYPLLSLCLVISLIWRFEAPLLAQSFSEALQAGITLYQQEDYTAAQDQLQAALRLNPEEQTALKYLGSTQVKLERYAEAVQTLEKLAEGIRQIETSLGVVAPESDLWYDLGVAYDYLNQIDKAKANYQKAVQTLSRFPNSLERNKPEDVFNNLGITQMATQEYSEALQSFQAATEKNQREGKSFYLKGLAQTNLGDYPAATQSFETATTPEVTFTFKERGYNGLGVAQYLNTEPQKAIAAWTQSIETSTEKGKPYAIAFANRGLGHFGRAEIKASEDDLAESLRLDPMNAKTYDTLGFVSYEIGIIARQVAQSEPTGKALEALPQGILSYFEDQVRHFAHLPPVPSLLATPSPSLLVAFLPGQLVDPMYAPRWQSYAAAVLANLSTQKLEAAVRAYESALKIEPEFANAQYGLATARRAQQDYPGALAAFQKAEASYRQAGNTEMAKATQELDIPAVQARLEPNPIQPEDQQVRAGFTFTQPQVTTLFDRNDLAGLTKLAIQEDLSPAVRREAVHALRLKRHRPAYPALQYRLGGKPYREPDQGVRSAILYFLEEVNSPSPVTPGLGIPVSTERSPRASTAPVKGATRLSSISSSPTTTPTSTINIAQESTLPASARQVRTSFPPPLGPSASGCGSNSTVSSAICRIRV
jgi:tetratricopeptide (TPR) repeat protein